MLTLREAGEYVGIPAKKLPVACSVRPVVMPDGSQRYDMHDLDAWLDSLKSGTSDSDDEILEKLK
jgi:hypothetical protein